MGLKFQRVVLREDPTNDNLLTTANGAKPHPEQNRIKKIPSRSNESDRYVETKAL